MTSRLVLLGSTLLTLLALSACSPQPSTSGRVDREPRTSNGVSVFGDARLGVVFD